MAGMTGMTEGGGALEPVPPPTKFFHKIICHFTKLELARAAYLPDCLDGCLLGCLVCLLGLTVCMAACLPAFFGLQACLVCLQPCLVCLQPGLSVCLNPYLPGLPAWLHTFHIFLHKWPTCLPIFFLCLRGLPAFQNAWLSVMYNIAFVYLSYIRKGF